MRTIVFKGKHIHVLPVNKELNRCWIEGYLSDENHINSPKLEGEVLIDKDTLCQYTELSACWDDFDNEPQEQDVWEHDLLEVDYKGKKVIAEVKYENGMYILASEDFADSYIPLFEVVEMEDGCGYVNAEHKGNIFDNPELLSM